MGVHWCWPCLPGGSGGGWALGTRWLGALGGPWGPPLGGSALGMARLNGVLGGCWVGGSGAAVCWGGGVPAGRACSLGLAWVVACWSRGLLFGEPLGAASMPPLCCRWLGPALTSPTS